MNFISYFPLFVKCNWIGSLENLNNYQIGDQVGISVVRVVKLRLVGRVVLQGWSFDRFKYER